MDSLLNKELPVFSAYRILPITYESPYKHGEDINGVWCGIEGATGATLEVKGPKGLEAEIILDIFNYNLDWGSQEKLLRGILLLC